MSVGFSYSRYEVLPSEQQPGPNLCTKNYVEVAIAQILNRDIPEHDDLWHEMINHHCFRGNDSKMILDEFWGDNGETPPAFYTFVKEYLKENGIDDTQYDDILLDITW